MDSGKSEDKGTFAQAEAIQRDRDNRYQGGKGDSDEKKVERDG